MPIAIAVLTIGLIVLVATLAIAAVAGAADAWTAPSPSATATIAPHPHPTPPAHPEEPASRELKRWMYRWFNAAVTAHGPYARACRALGIHPRPRVRPPTTHSLSKAGAYGLGRAYRDEARILRYRLRVMLYRMTHPHGHPVARWRALVRYTWPHWATGTVLRIIDRETGGTGNPRAWNTSSGAGGLTQLLPAPARWWDPLVNLRKAWRKFCAAVHYWGDGWQPWRPLP